MGVAHGSNGQFIHTAWDKRGTRDDSNGAAYPLPWTDDELRRAYQGGKAYCKSCNTAHERWQESGDHDQLTWECLNCGHFTRDTYMQKDEGDYFKPLPLTVDDEFRALIPALTAEEYSQLESNLLTDGCRDALVIWNGVIVDGHNRYEICRKHGLPFQTAERGFIDRDAAKVWIIRNQFGRRNLTSFVRSELALQLKAVIAAQAKERMVSGKKQDPVTMLSQGKTRAELASLADVSEGTMQKVETVTTKAPESVKAAARRGDLSVNRAYELTKTLEDAAPEVAEAAVAHNVTDPQLVQLLDAKKDTNTVQDALASGYLQDGDTAKPLSEATAWDLQGLLRKGEQEHREAARDARIAGKMAQIQSAPDGVFSVIYADPPWQYDNSGLHGAAERHYPTMPTADIGGLVKKIGLQSTEDAVLFLWATNPLLIDALEVIAAWGFQYKTNLVWVKDRSCYGRLGFYTQGQHELLLIATRGSFLPQFKPSSVMDLAKGAHSEKPTAVYALIETMYPVQRYVELFARDNQERPGWSFWGAEANAST